LKSTPSSSHFPSLKLDVKSIKIEQKPDSELGFYDAIVERLISSSVLYLYLHTHSTRLDSTRFGTPASTRAKSQLFGNLIIKINGSSSNMWYEMQTKKRINEHAAIGMERFALLCR
jgi:hypothetical protein